MKIKFLLITMFLTWAVCAQEIDKFIDQNHHDVDSSLIDSGFINDSIFKNSIFFFTGEAHGFRENMYIKKIIFELLNRKAGVRHILFEVPISMGYLLENYIVKGDSSVYRDLSIIEMDKDFLQFFEWLHKKNLALSQEQKIYVHAIDVEQNNNLGIKNLQRILPKSNAPDEIKIAVNLINKFIQPDSVFLLAASNRIYRNVISYIRKDFYAKSTIYESFLGDKYIEYKLAIESLYLGNFKSYDPYRLFHHNKKRYMRREVFLYENCKILNEKYPDKIFFGQFGKAHIHKTPSKEWVWLFRTHNSLASMLNCNEDSNVKNKVCSIGIFYPKTKKDWYYYYFDENKLKFANYTNNITMFRMFGANSPFEEIAKEVQYIIVNNNY